MNIRMPMRVVLAVPLAASLFAVAACGGSSSDAASTSASAATPAASDVADGLAVSDAWIKATDGPMTGAFAVIANPGADDITITSATAPVAGAVELHETVMSEGSMVMQPIAGGLVVPAGGQIVLEPGGNHIMLMGLTAPIAPGDDVPVTLALSSGESITFTAVAKEFAGANESYQPTPMASP